MYPDRDTFEQLYPARDTLQYVIKAWWKVAEKHCQFSLSGMNTNMKSQFKKQRFSELCIPEEKQQLVLGKSFIQWFWELNLCSYKNRVDCFDSLLLFLLSLLNWKSRNLTKHLKCYYDQILHYHFFSLDWQFSTWSTWCTNYSFIRLRKVVSFCAQNH